jgi:hypothetical protein
MVYLEALRPRILGENLERGWLASPFLLRTPRPGRGKLLADRALSRLLKGDWPRTLEEWENAHLKVGATTSEPRTPNP